MGAPLDLAIDFDAVLQKRVGLTPDGHLTTSQLMPHQVVLAPVPGAFIPVVARPVQVAYREEVPVSRETGKMERDRWVVLFDDERSPQGFRTLGDRLWEVPKQQAAVEAGVALLAEEGFGDWWWRVNLDALSMVSPCQCVLGQLSDLPEELAEHGFTYVAEDLVGYAYDPESRQWLIGWGFYADQDHEYAVLDVLWRAKIRQLRAEHPRAVR